MARIYWLVAVDVPGEHPTYDTRKRLTAAITEAIVTEARRQATATEVEIMFEGDYQTVIRPRHAGD